MKLNLRLWFLLGANLVLALLLVRQIGTRRSVFDAQAQETLSQEGIVPLPAADSPRIPLPKGPRISPPNSSHPDAPPTETVFARIYSDDLAGFAASLRAIHCPEQTVRDILVAEIGQRFRERTDALRPRPADDVPFSWSPYTHESKLVQRRQEASALAREKGALIREALGYEAPVPLPNYALRSSNQRFEADLAARTPEVQSRIREVDELYWSKVQLLQDRTKGFWQHQDAMDLDRLKMERKAAIHRIVIGL